MFTLDRGDIISKDDVLFYKKNGACVLRNILSVDEIDLLVKGITKNMSHPGPLAAVASDDNDPGLFFEDFCNWQRIPEYRDIIFCSRLPEIASKLMESPTVSLYHDHLLVKYPRTVQSTPWHQDQPYYNIDGHQCISFWVPVDPVPKEYSLEFVAGSHSSGTWYLPRTFLTKKAKWFPNGSLPDIPEDIETKETILSWDLMPGDVVAFHMLTIHGSKGSANSRRVFSVRYVGEDIRHAPRTWKTSPDFPTQLKRELERGAPMQQALFPVVWNCSP